MVIVVTPSKTDVLATLKTEHDLLIADRVAATQKVKDIDLIKTRLRTDQTTPTQALVELHTLMHPPPPVTITGITVQTVTGDEVHYDTLDQLEAAYPDVVF